MNLSIIIPNYNGAKFLSTCLKSISSCLKPSSLNYEIIVVDNGSTDGSEKKYQNTISLKKNYGFGYACNQGVKQANYDYVFILNNDTTLDKNFFVNLIKNFDPKYQCFCFTVLNNNGTKIESQGINFDYSGKCIQQQSNFHNSSSHSVWGSSAAAVIYHKNTFLKLNGFDSIYFNYIEDVDLAFRLHKNHYKTLLVSDCIVYHLGGGTSNKLGKLRQLYTFRNWFIFIFKNYSLFQIIRYFPQIFIERLRNLVYLLKSI